MKHTDLRLRIILKKGRRMSDTVTERPPVSLTADRISARAIICTPFTCSQSLRQIKRLTAANFETE